ncbi:hypothetical protein [Ornithinimicrobium kibberense]|uniref:hypothetical protein n=1 Tax=Ornithinimicrobium kibberense TaxID=282060 RepID=UPI003617C8C0
MAPPEPSSNLQASHATDAADGTRLAARWTPDLRRSDDLERYRPDHAAGHDHAHRRPLDHGPHHRPGSPAPRTLLTKGPGPGHAPTPDRRSPSVMLP